MDRLVFVYPHTGRPVLQWDGMYDPHPYVKAIFTFAEGGKLIPEMYGFKKPIHPVGWTYCKILPFKPKKDLKKKPKVLFAPIHVNGNAYLSKRERATNAECYSRLLQLGDQIDLTVRHLHKLEWNGLWKVRGVKIVKGKPDQSIKEILTSDVVITHQNMGYLAVASGIPTLFMSEYLVPMSASSDANLRYVKSWPVYKDKLMFPLDFMPEGSKGKGSMDRIVEAMDSDEKIKAWRKMFIGEPFDKNLFVRTIKKYLRGY